MSKIDKLLGKISKAKSAFKSLKGSLSDLSSALGVVDTNTLGEQAEQLRSSLESRRTELQEQNSKIKTATKESRLSGLVINELTFPKNRDAEIDNWIIFRILPRVADAKITTDSSLGTTEIRLYVPDGLKSSTAVAYGKEDFGVLKREINSLLQGGTLDAGAIMSKAKSTIIRKLMGGNINDLAEGRAVNPMDEVLLDGVDFREFTFNYDFNPTSEDEAIEVGKIINTFRRATLPNTAPFKIDSTTGKETDADDGINMHFYNYPNKFRVSFEGPIQHHVDGFLTMVCKNVEIDHDGGQKLSTFYTGQPVRTTMTLTMQEVIILTQQNYDKISAITNASESGRTYDEAGFGTKAKLQQGGNG